MLNPNFFSFLKGKLYYWYILKSVSALQHILSSFVLLAVRSLTAPLLLLYFCCGGIDARQDHASAPLSPTYVIYIPTRTAALLSVV